MGVNGNVKAYSATEVTNSFFGTLYFCVLDSSAKADCIELPNVETPVSVTADRTEISLYDTTALKSKDKYQVFQGGNHGCVEIEDIGNGTLLLLKDSFTNSLVPYLIGDYEKIIMIDLRYYSGTVNQLIAQKNPTQIPCSL